MWECLRHFFTSGGPLSSSKAHRDSQRVNAYASVLGFAGSQLNTAVSIPTNFAQMLMSGYSVFSKDTYASEKGIHAIEFALSTSQLIILSILLYQNPTTCPSEITSDMTPLCRSFVLIRLLYAGLVTVTAALAEASKDPIATPSEATLPAMTRSAIRRNQARAAGDDALLSANASPETSPPNSPTMRSAAAAPLRSVVVEPNAGQNPQVIVIEREPARRKRQVGTKTWVNINPPTVVNATAVPNEAILAQARAAGAHEGDVEMGNSNIGLNSLH